METFLKFVVKVSTALSALALLSIGFWSLFTGLPPLVAIVTLLLGGLLSFFTYVDVKNFIKKDSK